MVQDPKVYVEGAIVARSSVRWQRTIAVTRQVRGSMSATGRGNPSSGGGRYPDEPQVDG